MEGDLPSGVGLLAEGMEEKLWGKVLKSSPQYMESLNDNSINGRGTTVLRCSSWYEKHQFSRKHFHC